MAERTTSYKIDGDAALMDAGIDSHGAIELRHLLQTFIGAELPDTLIFDLPTSRKLATFLENGLNWTGAATLSSAQVDAPTGATVLAAFSTRLPMGARSALALGLCASDAICEVPLKRWSADACSATPDPIASRVRHGGFVESVTLFDNDRFRIAPAEAASMDPQQRLVLEHGYAALHATGASMACLDESGTGVFIGVQACEFPELLAALPGSSSVYSILGSSHAVTCGRMSYVLGMRGPCASYDTACSAGLVAVHAGSSALVLGECTSGLAAGINLMLLRATSAYAAAAGMTSALGRCHTFDARADGYVRSEGCCTTLLQDAEEAMHTRLVLCNSARLVLCNSAVRQDGRSASLTAPSGVAQHALRLAVHARSDLAEDSAVSAEAHGTGTALGDPIEVGSYTSAARMLGSAFGEVGSVKANVGHAEPAAGTSGLLSLVSRLEVARTACNAQLRALNERVRSVAPDYVAVAFNVHSGESASSNYGGEVCSFGYGGTIAQAVVCPTQEAEDGPLQDFQDVLVLTRREFSWIPQEVVADANAVGMFSCVWSKARTGATGSPSMLLLAGRESRAVDVPSKPTGAGDSQKFDICIVGGGMGGVTIARDVAACGFSAVILEMEPAIGGVWVKNSYPGLRLHSPGASYRCLSLAPQWQHGTHPAKDDLYYRASRDEVLAYIQEMASHPSITVRCGTSYQRHAKCAAGLEVVTTRGVVGARALVFATGTHEVTAGEPMWPVDTSGKTIHASRVANGALVVHSADLATHKAAFDAAKTRYVLGSSKAAIDILNGMDTEDSSLVWAHRGHVIFLRREAIHESIDTGAPEPAGQIKAQRIGSIQMSNQKFDTAFEGLLKSNRAHRVGLEMGKQPWMRGGIESEATIAKLRKFLPRQRLIESVDVHEGVLTMNCADGKRLAVGDRDAIVFCTGQRAESAGVSSYARRAKDNADGIFSLVPYASATPMCALYVTRLLLAHLQGDYSPYTSGSISAALAKNAAHMLTLPDSGAWARFQAYLGGVMANVATQIFDPYKFGAWDLSSSYLWTGEWFGKDLDVARIFRQLAADVQPLPSSVGRLTTAAVLLDCALSVAPNQEGTRMLLGLAQQVAQLRGPGASPLRTLLLTSGAPQVPALGVALPHHGGAWGLARALRLEVPTTTWRSVGVAQTPSLAGLAASEDEEVYMHGDRCFSSRLRLNGRVRVAVSSSEAPANWLVTGGLGGLGLSGAALLAQWGAVRIALISRSGSIARDGQGLENCLRELCSSNTSVALLACDSGSALLIQAAWQGALPSGMLHTAGGLHDKLLRGVDSQLLSFSVEPKALGAAHLHALGGGGSLVEALGLFSSVAAMTGSFGQASYSAANAWLDSISVYRTAGGLVASSLQLLNVAGVGMFQAGVDAGVLEVSWKLDLDAYATCIQLLSMGSSPPCTWSPLPFDLAVLPPWLEKTFKATFPTLQRLVELPDSGVLGEVGSTPSGAVGATSSTAGVAAVCSSPSMDQMATANMPTLEAVIAMVKSASGIAVTADAPLMEAGVDSLALVELSNQFQAAVGAEASLPSMMVFDHPTARQLLSSLEPAQPAIEAAEVAVAASRAVNGRCDARRGVASVDGVSASIPGAGSSALSAARMASCGAQAVSEVPVARWDVKAQPALPEPLASRVRHAGFVDGVALIDNAAFLISPAETAAMDPCQRLVLERAYAAIHDGSLERAALCGSTMGVFLGFAFTEFAQVLSASPAGGSVYAATGSTVAVASGRVSYALGLHGPCASYDTACSASLVAAHAGLRALQLAECANGLVAGVTLMLGPGYGTSNAIAGMTSATGRSHTFDNRADGFVKGEACGAIVLQQDEQDDFRTDGRLCMTGSAVRQDGRSASLTAPNGQAQQGLLVAALADAGLAFDELALDEAHGTGTTLGDPIETRAKVSARARLLASRDSLPVGAVKANIGHAEPAAGMTGLLKLGAALIGGEATPNAQLHQMNPHLFDASEQMQCALPVQMSQSPAECQAGCVSSFGYSGTIGSTLLRCVTAGRSKHAVQWVPSAYRRRLFLWDLPDPTARLIGADETSEAIDATLAGVGLELGLEAIIDLVSKLAGGCVDADVALMEGAIDSLGATEMLQLLGIALRFEGTLPQQFLFDHPTPRSMVELFEGRQVDVDNTDVSAVAVEASLADNTDASAVTVEASLADVRAVTVEASLVDTIANDWSSRSCDRDASMRRAADETRAATDADASATVHQEPTLSDNGSSTSTPAPAEEGTSVGQLAAAHEDAHHRCSLM